MDIIYTFFKTIIYLQHLTKVFKQLYQPSLVPHQLTFIYITLCYHLLSLSFLNNTIHARYFSTKIINLQTSVMNSSFIEAMLFIFIVLSITAISLFTNILYHATSSYVLFTISSVVRENK